MALSIIDLCKTIKNIESSIIEYPDRVQLMRLIQYYGRMMTNIDLTMYFLTESRYRDAKRDAYNIYITANNIIKICENLEKDSIENPSFIRLTNTLRANLESLMFYLSNSVKYRDAELVNELRVIYSGLGKSLMKAKAHYSYNQEREKQK
jgi:hypothetical protein